MQDGGLDLEEALGIQTARSALITAVRGEVVHLIGIHDQIGRASAQAGLGVGEGIEGDGVQALAAIRHPRR